MRRAVVVVTILVLVGLGACGGSSSSATAALCQDLTNLQSTVALLADPPSDATVGDVRGALEKLDSTWDALHDDNATIPDDEDAALTDAKDEYGDAIEDFGDDDAFAPHAAATAGVAARLQQSYEDAKSSLACPADLTPG